ncbi:MAG TPA: hypothetical protein VLL98_01585 [Rickettsiales bacterium]|nr:hypothetical protein [Rickettsiales bacterium]
MTENNSSDCHSRVGGNPSGGVVLNVCGLWFWVELWCWISEFNTKKLGIAK